MTAPDWILAPQTARVAALTQVPAARRDALRDGPKDGAAFRAAFDAIPALREVETGGPPPAAASAAGWLRLVAWNVERLRHAEAVAAHLAAAAPDACLLTELDAGMARTGNSHRTAWLAGRLGQSYAYGVEFVELDRGDAAERAAAGAVPNAQGFHGNAILSRLALHRPAVLRLEAEGAWFDGTRGEPRVGGRMALAAQVRLDGRPVTLVAVHLESHSDPAHRDGQVARLLDLIAAYDPDAPVAMGGDFNTSTQGWPPDPALDAADPGRRMQAWAHEPMFARLAAAGFDWRAANRLDLPTERFAPGARARAPGRIDWFFTRGLKLRNPGILPALRPDGGPASDHDGLLLEVALS